MAENHFRAFLPASAGSTAAETAAAKATRKSAAATKATAAAAAKAPAHGHAPQPDTSAVAMMTTGSPVMSLAPPEYHIDHNETYEKNGEIAGQAIGRRGTSAATALEIPLQNGDNLIRSGLNTPVKIALPESRQDVVFDDHLGLSIGEVLLEAIAILDGDLLFLQSDKHDQSIVLAFFPYPPLLAQFGCIEVGVLAGEVLHDHHHHLGRGRVRVVYQFLIERALLLRFQEASVIVDWLFALLGDREAALLGALLGCALQTGKQKHEQWQYGQAPQGPGKNTAELGRARR